MWQDQLLANYRTLAVTGATGLVVATSVAAAVATTTPGSVAWAAAAVAMLLAALNGVVVRRMRELTAHRALDVDWWTSRALAGGAEPVFETLREFKQDQDARGPHGDTRSERPEDGPGRKERHARGAIERTLFNSLQVAGWAMAALAVFGVLS